MNSKQKILDALGRCQLPETELPSLDENWTTYPDARQQFHDVLATAGGTAIDVASHNDIGAALQQVQAFREAERIWSLVPQVRSSGGDWTQANDPHELESLEFCVAPGQFAVAENGAVWLTDEVITPRAALFITQHLALVVPASEIVHNMHQAYDRISLNGTRFGLFISGPSKTADIEQSLVIGGAWCPITHRSVGK